MCLPEIVTTERCTMCYHLVYEFQAKSPSMKIGFKESKISAWNFETKNARRLEKLETGRYAIMQIISVLKKALKNCKQMENASLGIESHGR